MPPKSPNHAIVYGASGLIGWALINQLLSPYPAAGTFQKVTAVTNRPLDASGTYWPEADLNRPQLQLASGVDLRSWDRVRLVKWLREVVENSEGVTHVYYLAFAAMDDDLEEVATNRRMLQNVIDAHNLISPKLQFVAFVGGTRGYGIYSAGGTFTPPLREELVNSLPSDYAKTVVYPAYREILRTSSKGRKWTWCEVCPDAIVGFTPNGSQFSLALHWAQYLSLYAYNHGIGPHNQGKEEATKASVEVPFPGSTAGATSLFSPVSSSRLARFMIFASLHPEMCGDGRLFNVADRATPCTYGSLWPRLAEWFGLVSVPPIEPAPETEHNTLKVGEVPERASNLAPGEYITKYRDIFTKNGCPRAVTGGVGVGYRQLDSVGYWLTFDRQLSVERLRDTGFEGDQDPVEGWLESFAMFRRAGLIL
ncbi:SDR family oxidoreductase [Aspergillus tubingensis]|uniref:SDR family oxidoreductase n=1 Tax=Aspergillus tubingensis TaxID=5068 RepID=UPI001579FB3E|nr:tannase and feruloyl esterase family protein [Aspergillus tubingensis]GFN18552.1 tannase and feruloyl esterase family protein [Aspergillus tubingensis]